MNKMVYIPQKEVDSIKKAAAEATETGGIGAYLVKLHKAEQGRKDDGR
jgi:hypothetical protein